MTTFEYVIPADLATVKRLFTDDTLQHDQFAILVDGDTVATVNYSQARAYWKDETTLAAILDGQAKNDKNEAPTGYNFSTND